MPTIFRTNFDSHFGICNSRLTEYVSKEEQSAAVKERQRSVGLGGVHNVLCFIVVFKTCHDYSWLCEACL